MSSSQFIIYNPNLVVRSSTAALSLHAAHQPPLDEERADRYLRRAGECLVPLAERSMRRRGVVRRRTNPYL